MGSVMMSSVVGLKGVGHVGGVLENMCLTLRHSMVCTVCECMLIVFVCMFACACLCACELCVILLSELCVILLSELCVILLSELCVIYA